MIIDSIKEEDVIQNVLNKTKVKSMNTKYALITGGSSGLGLHFALNLAKQGYVPIIISRSKERVDSALKQVQNKGFEAMGFTGDIASISDMQSIYKQIEPICEKIDFLIQFQILSAFFTSPFSL